MMISATAQYALRAVIFLADYGRGYATRAQIANATLAPNDYLLKVLQLLEHEGLISSRRGPGGGYCLEQDPKRLSVLDVVYAVDERMRIDQCPLGISAHRELCPLHALLDEASRKVEEVFQGATVADLIPSNQKKSSCDFPKAV